MANIAFDIDDTITDYHGYLKQKAKEFTQETGLKCKFYRKSYSGILFPTKYEEHVFWKKYEKPYLDKPMLHEARCAIEKLYRAGHNIYFISKRDNRKFGFETGYDVSLLTLHWLNQQEIIYNGVVCTLGQDKIPWMKFWDIDYMLDDVGFSTEVLPKCKLYLLDKPYNRAMHYGTRVPSIAAFANIILDNS